MLKIGTLEIDGSAGRAAIDGRDVRLRPLDLRVLVALASQPDRAVSRAALSEALWGAHTTVDERSIDACVKRLRRALNGAGDAIVTVRRVGYRLDPQRLGRGAHG